MAVAQVVAMWPVLQPTGTSWKRAPPQAEASLMDNKLQEQWPAYQPNSRLVNSKLKAIAYNTDDQTLDTKRSMPHVSYAHAVKQNLAMHAAPPHGAALLLDSCWYLLVVCTTWQHADAVYLHCFAQPHIICQQ